jgi:uncharacterized protein (DUF488 family)
VIYSIGTGHRSLQELLELLRSSQVTQLADVRSYPKSHLPHFCRDQLEHELAAAGLRYEWVGNDLGGLRREGYREYMRTPRFLRGIERLEDLARHGTVAMCCAEVDPDQCHRRHIADALVGRGWEVVHLIALDRQREHVVLPEQGQLPLE